MKKTCLFILGIAFSTGVFAAQVDVAHSYQQVQIKNFAIMQINNQLMQVSDQLGSKKMDQMHIQKSLKEINSTLILSKTFLMQHKVSILNKEKLKAENDLRQLSVDIRSLEKQKNTLIKNQKQLMKL